MTDISVTNSASEANNIVGFLWRIFAIYTKCLVDSWPTTPPPICDIFCCKCMYVSEKLRGLIHAACFTVCSVKVRRSNWKGYDRIAFRIVYLNY